MADPVRLRIDELDAAAVALIDHVVAVAQTDGTTEKLLLSQIFSLLTSQAGILGSIGPIQDIASAASVDLSAAPAFRYRVTGTVTISEIVIGTNKRAFLRFSATPTVEHDATTLILPTDADITAAVDDIAMIESDGDGNVRVAAWFRKDGTALVGASSNLVDQAINAEQNVASAGTTDLVGASATAFRYRITGTTTITALTLGVNKWAIIRFAGVLTLTHNATTLILPNGANIVTAANDVALIATDGSGNIRVLNYIRSGDRAKIDAIGTMANRAFTVSTSDPSGGANGDIHFKVA